MSNEPVYTDAEIADHEAKGHVIGANQKLALEHDDLGATKPEVITKPTNAAGIPLDEPAETTSVTVADEPAEMEAGAEETK